MEWKKQAEREIDRGREKRRETDRQRVRERGGIRKSAGTQLPVCGFFYGRTEPNSTI